MGHSARRRGVDLSGDSFIPKLLESSDQIIAFLGLIKIDPSTTISCVQLYRQRKWMIERMILNDIAWYCMVFNDIEWYWMVLNDIEWYCMILNDTEWYWMILNDIELYWIILHGIQWYWMILNDNQFIHIWSTPSTAPAPSTPSTPKTCQHWASLTSNASHGYRILIND